MNFLSVLPTGLADGLATSQSLQPEHRLIRPKRIGFPARRVCCAVARLCSRATITLLDDDRKADAEIET